MAVTCFLRRLSDEEIDFLLLVRSEEDVTEFLRGLGEPEPAGLRTPRPSIWSRLFGKGKASNEPETKAAAAYRAEELDLYKSWHGLHYLLTGRDFDGDWPLNLLYGAGTAVGGVGGSSCALTSNQVWEVAAALSLVSVDDLRTRFDPVKMEEMGIYPQGWDQAPADEMFQFLGEHFEELKQFIEGASEQSRALIICVGYPVSTGRASGYV
jgi:Domain of unknown function (DUF1877)